MYFLINSTDCHLLHQVLLTQIISASGIQMGDGWNTVLGSIVLGWLSFILRLLQIDLLDRGHILLRSHHRTWEITETRVRGSWGEREKQTYHLHALYITVMFSNSGVKLTSELDKINPLSSFAWQCSSWASWQHLWEDARHICIL